MSRLATDGALLRAALEAGDAAVCDAPPLTHRAALSTAYCAAPGSATEAAFRKLASGAGVPA